MDMATGGPRDAYVENYVLPTDKQSIIPCSLCLIRNGDEKLGFPKPFAGPP